MSGELFLWNRDKDVLKTSAAVPEVAQMLSSTKGLHCICLNLTINLKKV